MKQITFNIQGDKIKVIARGITRMGNLMGFSVRVNDKRYFFNVLTYSQAIEKGYIKYIKENR